MSSQSSSGSKSSTDEPTSATGNDAKSLTTDSTSKLTTSNLSKDKSRETSNWKDTGDTSPVGSTTEEDDEKTSFPYLSETNTAFMSKLMKSELVNGLQADRYSVGDQVFVKHEAVAWPAVIEDPSNVTDLVTRFQYAVFLYGIHERKVVKLKDIYLFDENKKEFGKKTCHMILNMALVEARMDPNVNLRRIPPHKRRPYRLLRKSRSHTMLDRYLANKCNMVIEEQNDLITRIKSSTSANSLFSKQKMLSCDSTLGYIAIISSFLFLLYMTIWIIFLPFLQPEYQSVVEDLFPHPAVGISFPIAGATVMACSIIAFFGAISYGPRVKGVQIMEEVTDSPNSGCDSGKRFEELLLEISKRQPALFITVVLGIVFMTPVRFFASIFMFLGGSYLIRDLLYYL